jgi:DNA-binding response OmpR family regulator
MPEMDGIEVCFKLRNRMPFANRYLILLTIKNQEEDTIQGLDAGADDFITKPFDRDILQARLRVGERVVALQEAYQQKVFALQNKLNDMTSLGGLLHICSSCKKIRDENKKWVNFEAYIEDKTDAHFSHGMCLECMNEMYPGRDWGKIIEEATEDE